MVLVKLKFFECMQSLGLLELYIWYSFVNDE